MAHPKVIRLKSMIKYESIAQYHMLRCIKWYLRKTYNTIFLR